MRRATTLILFLLAAAAVAFVWFFERHQPGTTEAGQAARLVLQLDPKVIDGIEITGSTGTVRLEKEGPGPWRMTKPAQDRADGAAVQEILKFASEADVQESLSGREKVSDDQLKEFGLDAAGATLVKFTQGGKVLGGARIGRVAPYDSTAYVRPEPVEGKPGGIVIAVVKCLPVLTRAADEFRDRRLLGATPETVTRINFKSGEAVVDLAREKPVKGSLWRLTQPLAIRADQEFFDSALPDLLNLKAAGFLDKAPAPPADAPVLTVMSGSGTPEALQIYPGPEGAAFVKSSVRPVTARATGETAAVLLNLAQVFTLERLRSSRLAVLDPRSVTTIGMKSARGTDIALHQVGKNWYLTRGGKVWDANNDRVVTLFKALNEWELPELIQNPGPAAEYGLDQPWLEFTFAAVKHAAKSRPSPIPPGQSLTLQIGEAGNKFFAKWTGEPYVYPVSPLPLKDIPVDGLKWKSTRLLGFAAFSLRELTLAQDPAPPLELKFDLKSGATWTARRLEADVTPLLDMNRVNLLAQKFSEFSAADWMSDAATGAEALKNPSLRVKLVIEQYDETRNAPKPFPIELHFAPIAAGARAALYYGRIEGEPDVFTITRAAYEELTQPLLKEGGAGR